MTVTIEIPEITKLSEIKEVSPKTYYSTIFPSAKITEDNPEKAALAEFKKMFDAFDHNFNNNIIDNTCIIFSTHTIHRTLDKFKIGLFTENTNLLFSASHKNNPDLVQVAFETYTSEMAHQYVDSLQKDFDSNFIQNTIIPHSLAAATADFYNGIAEKNNLPKANNYLGYRND